MWHHLLPVRNAHIFQVWLYKLSFQMKPIYPAKIPGEGAHQYIFQGEGKPRGGRGSGEKWNDGGGD